MAQSFVICGVVGAFIFFEKDQFAWIRCFRADLWRPAKRLIKAIEAKVQFVF
jgi:hypothetical protein